MARAALCSILLLALVASATASLTGAQSPIKSRAILDIIELYRRTHGVSKRRHVPRPRVRGRYGRALARYAELVHCCALADVCERNAVLLLNVRQIGQICCMSKRILSEFSRPRGLMGETRV